MVNHLVEETAVAPLAHRSTLEGGDVCKIGLLHPARLERMHEDGEYFLRLILTGACPHGDPSEVTYELRKTPTNSRGGVPMDRDHRQHPGAAGGAHRGLRRGVSRRNQVESFFSWLERCFWIKDRHASWGRDAQLFDLLAAALLRNSIAWAHLAYRHPEHAQTLRTQLQASTRPIRPSRRPHRPSRCTRPGRW